MNLTYGPAADGTCAEIQVYADEATSKTFSSASSARTPSCRRSGRAGRADRPAGSRSVRFEGMDLLGQSFVRDEVGLWSPPG